MMKGASLNWSMFRASWINIYEYLQDKIAAYAEKIEMMTMVIMIKI